MAEKHPKNFWLGLCDAIPIGSSYLAVSFTLGIQATTIPLEAWQSGAIAFFAFSSTAQKAGMDFLATGGSLLSLALTQLVINLRYGLMSCAMSQRISPTLGTGHRLLMAFGMTDEIFGVAINSGKPVRPSYFYGLTLLGFSGWFLGSTLGVVIGSRLPAALSNALCIAIYAMFIGIVVPMARTHRAVLWIALAAAALSVALFILPFTSEWSSGMRIVFVTLLVAGMASIVRPIREEEP